jgi:ABC-type phosphate transport system substrate-binding protein
MHPEMSYRRPAPARPPQARAAQVQRRRFVLAVGMLSLMVIITAVSSRSCAEEASAVSTPTGATSTSPDPLAGLVSASYQAQLTPAAPGSAAAAGTAVLTPARTLSPTSWR